VLREGSTLRLRVFNPSAEPATAVVEGRHGWVVDLRGRPVAPFEGTVELRPWEVATLALAD